MGHGLNLENVRAIVQIPGVEELNIGHSIVARAVLVGMERAVRDMKEAMRGTDMMALISCATACGLADITRLQATGRAAYG